jgi:hypothetical protein
MPTRSKLISQARLRKIWRDWGLFLILVAVILIGGIVALIVRANSSRQPQIGDQPPYRVYFTQGDLGEPAPEGLEAVIVKDVAAAKTSVDVATPGLDLPRLVDALIAAQGRGVEVRVLEEAASQESPTVVTATGRLRAAGIAVVLREAKGRLGESFLVVDKSLVWAGSWDLSQNGLTVDDALVLRWNIAQMAQDFHDEFNEMFVDGAYGPGSPADTAYKYVAIAVPSSGNAPATYRAISIYLTPEDDPYSQVLQSMAKVKGAIIVLTGGIDDARLGDRLTAESGRTDISVWGIVGDAGSSRKIVDDIRAHKAGVLDYRGKGQLRDSVIVVDAETVCIFSQPLVRTGLDQNDGYVIVVVDRDLGAIIQREFGRLAKAVQ